jgi:phosphoenolpyruvate carboxylase
MDPVVELGFWPGGDRDGNPFITAVTTRNICSRLHGAILALYLRDMKQLLRRLTFPGIIDSLRGIEARLRCSVFETANPEYLSSLSTEPTTPAGEEVSGYENADEFLADLVDVACKIHKEHGGLFLEQIAELIYRVRIFGFYFASMDIRQDSRIHVRTVAELLSLLGLDPGISSSDEYTAMNTKRRIDILVTAADRSPPVQTILSRLSDGFCATPSRLFLR